MFSFQKALPKHGIKGGIKKEKTLRSSATEPDLFA
jgi:hypothetical protein